MRNHLSHLLIAVAFTPPLFAQALVSPMQTIGRFEIDRTGVSIGEYQKSVDATKTVTIAVRAGGGRTYEFG